MSRLSDRGNWWRGIAPGDQVTYATPQGNTKSGKVVISTATHVVIEPCPIDMDHPRLHKTGWVRVTSCYPRAIAACREFVTKVRRDTVGADDEAIRRLWPMVSRDA